jgi:TolB-like protein/DNA-binding winged helix-turn-helix (wHTH) protein/tetratricopeptide (TPR) repeat protein
LLKKVSSDFPQHFRGTFLETFMAIAQSKAAEVLRSRLVEGDFRLADWTVQPRLNTLIANGRAVRIEPKVMQVLICLAEARDVVSKEQLMQKVWSDTFVTDDVLTRCISELRKAFDDDPKRPRYIQTIPKSGYRLIPTAEAMPTPVQPSMHEPSAQIDPSNLGPPHPSRRVPRILVACVVASLMIAIPTAWYLISRSTPATSHSMLAVLPFQNLSNDREQDYFADGLTAEMISQLGRLPSDQLGVINWNSMMRYKGTRKSEDEIARAVGAQYVLQGTVRRSGNHVRITAELSRFGDHTHLWANSYDGELGDVLELQSRVAREIASEIRVRLNAQQAARLSNPAPLNPDGYVAYLKGRFSDSGTTERALRERIEKLQEAIRINPGHVPAYAGLATAYRGLASFGYASAKDSYAQSRSVAMKALEIDPGSADANRELAWIEWRYDWNFPAAEKHFQRAIELAPGDSQGHHEYSLYLKSMGRYQESLREVIRALELSPLDSFARTNAGSLLGLLQNYGEAEEQFRKALNIDPSQPYIYLRLGTFYLWQGKTSQAISELERAVELSNRQPEKLAWLSYAYARAGRTQDANRLLAEISASLAAQKYVSPLEVALAYLGTGDKQSALQHLEKAYQQRDEWMVYLNVYPEFQSLHDEPQFQDLQRRMNLPKPPAI